MGGRAVSTDGKLTILSIRQRPDNPCIVEVDFKISGDGVFGFSPDLCCFSLNTTNGINGEWHLLKPITTDAKFIGTEFEVHGIRIGTFVFDGCDHVSSFFSEKKLTIRLTAERLADSSPTWNLPSTVNGLPNAR